MSYIIQPPGWRRTGDSVIGKYIVTQSADDNIFELNKTGTGTGNPLTITNAGTGRGIEVNQNGNGILAYFKNYGTQFGIALEQNDVLASGRAAFQVYSTYDQTTGYALAYIRQHGTGSTIPALGVVNDGTGHGLSIDQNGDGVALNIDNAGTESGIYINQTGVLASGKHSIYVYSDAAQTYAPLMKIHQDNASSSSSALWIVNDGTGKCINAESAGTGTGILLNITGTLGTDQPGLYVYSNVAQTSSGSPLVYIFLDDASSTTNTLSIRQDGSGRGISLVNNGTGNGIFIDQNGDGVALVIDSEAVSQPAIYVDHAGTSKYAMKIYSAVANSDTEGFIIFQNNNTSTTTNILRISNAGTGSGILIDQDGTGSGLYIDADYTGDFGSANKGALTIDNNTPTIGLVIHQKGVLDGTQVSRRHALYVYTAVDHTATDPLVFIRQDSTASNAPTFGVWNKSPSYGVYIDQDGDGVALNIDSEATTANTLAIESKVNTGTAYALLVNTRGAGCGFQVYRPEGVGDAIDLVRILQDDSTATYRAVYLKNDGTGNGLFIGQNGNGIALNINSNATTTNIIKSYCDDEFTGTGANCANFFILDNTSSTGDLAIFSHHGSGDNVRIHANFTPLATGKHALVVESTVAQTNSSLVQFKQDDSGSTQNVFDVWNDGTGSGIFIDQNGDGKGVLVDSEATTQPGIQVDMSSADYIAVKVNVGKLDMATNYLIIGNITSLPTASSAYRGHMIYVPGGTGISDKLYICLKGSDDTYSWVQLATG
ncbi:MAG: hypothetical protein ACTSX6_00370 [Candidatus Heimdallarchaeaceae archaeon]